MPQTLAAVFAALSAVCAAAPDVKTLAYDGSGSATSVGDLLLPDGVDRSTPVVLVIHGGGWSSMSRRDLVGIARFFRDELGFAAFNIDYRLASAKNRWPACGDDCVQAAKYLLSRRFTEQTGLAPSKIWVCGASAGGHLALWTGLSLPKDAVAGVVAISPIGDPRPDFGLYPQRYRNLFGDDAARRLSEMDPCRLADKPGPPVLVTHATRDPVVPIESARVFVSTYRRAGGVCEMYEYDDGKEPNTGGHAIWRPGIRPNRLLVHLESRITGFVRKHGGGLPLTMMSFNVRMGCGLKDPFRLAKGSLGYLPAVAKVIRSVDPDWVAVQEIDRGTTRAGGVDQTAELARLCGLHGTFVRKVGQPGGDYGLAVLSKGKPTGVSKISLPGSVHPRAAMVVEFARYRVVCTHFPLDAKLREKAAGILCSELAGSEKPLFLAGDINASPGEASVALLKKAFTPLNDVAAPTYPADAPARCIDYLFIGSDRAADLTVTARRTIAAPEATDHCAVVVTACLRTGTR